MNSFAGKVALVTGGAGSVGAAVVSGLARRGATVIVNCFHSYDRAKILAADLNGDGLDVVVMRASVAKPDHVEEMIEKIEKDFGRLDVLVNNAAVGKFSSLNGIDEQSFDRVFATNVKAPLWCIKYARPLLAAAGGGSVVNVSSIGATHAIDDYLLIGASKAALESMTRYLAVELAPEKIRVNTASAGLIDNSAARLFPQPDQFAAKIAAATPMGRLGTPDDLAKVVLFLASAEAGWITGQTILADGGLLLGPATFPPVEPQCDDGPKVGADIRSNANDGSPPTMDPVPTSISGSPELAEGSLPALLTGHDSEPVAIVGMGIAVPGASSPDEFWSLLNRGAELFVDPPPDRWSAADFVSADKHAPDKSYQGKSGFIATFIPHERLRADEMIDDPEVDYNTVWLRHCLYQAVEQTVLRSEDQVSLCVGFSADNSHHLEESVVLRSALSVLDDVEDQLSKHGADQIRKALENNFHGATGDGSSYLPGRIVRDAMARILPDNSRVQIVDAACASSLNALDLGIRAIRSGRADVAFCGGGEALTPTGTVLFAKLRGLSPTGAVRSLDAAADGVLFCDGAGVVALKSLRRAIADDDHIYGVVSGVGLASDGKGKAIYAPSSVGQKLAIERALTAAGLQAHDIDYIVAHSTGTPAGDSTEIAALNEAYASDRPTWIGSNKSLIGHAGWGAGVISVIQLLLALQHEAIPPQFRFDTPSAGLAAGSTGVGLTVPLATVPWRSSPASRRTGAVSAFGFGGADAHVLVQECRHQDVPGTPAVVGEPESRSTDKTVIVGWSAHLPGAESTEDVTSWLHGNSTDIRLSFGEKYPAPPFQQLRLPGSSVRATDRSQLMLIECVHRLAAQARGMLQALNDRVGVVVGHVGIVRNSALYKLRVHLDKIARVLYEEDIDADTAVYLRSLGTLTDRLQDPACEDSNPGEMPNIIAARLCNYFDLHGLGMTVDNGPDSLAEAFDIAESYLNADDLDVVLVGAINGNTLPVWHAHIKPTLRDESAELQEGAFLFAVTRESIARDHGLPIITTLSQIRCAALEVDHV